MWSRLVAIEAARRTREFSMKLFLFASTSATNTWAGIGANTWAVSERRPSAMKGLRTKAAKMLVGSAGALWCSELQGLTTPFIVSAPPDPDRVVEDIWPERWCLPFGIHPLGTPRKSLPKHRAMGELEVIRERGHRNISQALPIAATTVFSPVEISERDWAHLLANLAE